MTADRKALRERVASAIRIKSGDDPDTPPSVFDLELADAAIAVVLEEAARVCETRIESEIDTHGRYFAAAIRALISSDASGS